MLTPEQWETIERAKKAGFDMPALSTDPLEVWHRRAVEYLKVSLSDTAIAEMKAIRESQEEWYRREQAQDERDELWGAMTDDARKRAYDGAIDSLADAMAELATARAEVIKECARACMIEAAKCKKRAVAEREKLAWQTAYELLAMADAARICAEIIRALEAE